MTKFKEVIAGITKNLVQVRREMDEYTKELFETYQKDPFLKLMPVPHIAMKTVNLNLKLGIKNFQGRVDENSIQKVFWENLLPNVYRKYLARTVAVGDFTKIIVAPFSVWFSQNPDKKLSLISDSAENILSRTIEILKNFNKLLSAEMQNAINTANQFEKEIQSALKSSLDAIAPLKQEILNKSGIDDFEVYISAEDLQSLDKSLLQEVTLTLQLDDIQVLDSQTINERTVS